jgi:[protein-PII] uridylyltransferase
MLTYKLSIANTGKCIAAETLKPAHLDLRTRRWAAVQACLYTAQCWHFERPALLEEHTASTRAVNDRRVDGVDLRCLRYAGATCGQQQCKGKKNNCGGERRNEHRTRSMVHSRIVEMFGVASARSIVDYSVRVKQNLRQASSLQFPRPVFIFVHDHRRLFCNIAVFSGRQSSMNDTVHRLRSFLASRREEIATAHRAGASGFSTCSSLTVMMDEGIRVAFESLTDEHVRKSKGGIAVIALGGYGRAELSPRSDTDIMVLCESGDMRTKAEEIAKSFLHLLWDAGVDIGHSVRTTDDVLAMHSKNLDSWASVVEGRFVCGNEGLAGEFADALKARIAAGSDIWFIEGVFADVRNRHERYGNSVKLLEPNVKKSAGGLRDLHALFWLFRANHVQYLTPLNPSGSACGSFLDALQARGVLDSDEHGAALHALEFLLRTRHAMHYRRDSPHDALDYSLQLEVAEGLGYGPRAELRSVEVFMHDYYLHARTIHRLHQRLAGSFKEMIEPAVHGEERKGERVTEHIVLLNDVLSVDPSVHRFSGAEDLFHVFLLAAEREATPDFRLRAVIERSADLITPEVLSSPALGSVFGRILRSRRVAQTLREMNDLDVLGRYLPEFGELEAFFQHNVYHYFTADEHTLIAVARAEELRDQHGILREVFRNLRRKDVLYLAILLHDIAKPRGVADHEITGVEVARAILQRVGMSDAFDDVAFLIRHHLLMEQIAFRRNIHDPETIKELAAIFERPEQLDYLYLLTYADLSAVNINVWTEWKASMLQDLYLHTAEVLTRQLHGQEIDVFHQEKQEAAVMEIVDKLSSTMSRERVERHLGGIQSAAYTALFTEEEIGRHIHVSASGEPVTTLFAHSEGYTEVTVIAHDAPFALSKFCAVLAANEANIFDANIFTRDDGIIIDRFRVAGASSRQQLDQSVCNKIADDIKHVAAGDLDIEHLFAAHRRKWKRKPRMPLNPNIRVGVEFEDNPRYTIIDVYAPDSVGFLYRITETISKLGLDIYFAKIATRVDGIVDAFYVLDRSGNRITDPSAQTNIRQAILATVQTIAEEQLA